MLRTISLAALALLLAGAGIALAQTTLPPPSPVTDPPAGPTRLPVVPPAAPIGHASGETSYLPPVEQPPPRCGMSPLSPGWGWRNRDSCATITPGALPQPNGWFVHQWNERMAMKAEADDFVIYNHEWYMGGVVPGPYGFYHIDQIARRLDSVPFPVLIQLGGPPELIETRRRAVVEMLAAKGVHDAEHRVVAGFPEAEGLRLNDLPARSQGGGRGGRGSGGGTGGSSPFGVFGLPGGLGGGGAGGARGY